VSVQEFRVNNRIRVPEVRLISETGEQVGIVQIKDARRMAEEAGLDLVEVAPNAKPPVCRILDYGKFKYQQRKKEKKGGVKHTSTLKELRVRPAIDDHDLEYRLDSGRRFLQQGHKVQVVCVFKGRQMAHPEHGYEVMKKVEAALADISKVESQPRMLGKRMTMLLSHRPGGAKVVTKPPLVQHRVDPAAVPAQDGRPAVIAPVPRSEPQEGEDAPSTIAR
jgi:translation initiation factor IF-3